jgi:NCK-associated protein 1
VQYILLHEEYQQYVLPRIAESKKLAKAGRSKGRDADAEYNLAKQVEKQIWWVHKVASCQLMNDVIVLILLEEIHALAALSFS